MHITLSGLSRSAAVAAILAGIGFIIVGLFHPLNIPRSITTETWVNVHIVAILMCFFGMFGLTGIYLRQAVQAGWLGLIGYLLLFTWFAGVIAFSVIEAFVLPTMTVESPRFIDAFLGMFDSLAAPNNVNLNHLPLLWMLSGPAYIAGQLLFCIATFWADVLSRWAGALLAASAAITMTAAFIPPEYQPLVMMPVGFAFVCLGLSLWVNQEEA